MAESIDILENDILELSPHILKILLKDHSVSHHYGSERNIFWATPDYEALGNSYGYYCPITPELITGKHGHVIQPRARKSREVQQLRVQAKAEVFTPAWICNKQNNLIDNDWFGRDGVFNTELDEDGKHSWVTTEDKILFPDNRTWQDYVCAPRLEVACGEAPYITSRYDATLCNSVIPTKDRIGFLDRKLRIVCENTATPEEWHVWAFNALHATYGYEWQGDNLLLAREAVLYTFKEHFEAKFQQPIDVHTLENAAYIISWNLWQMDGVKCVVPMSCEWAAPTNGDLFSGSIMREECLACKGIQGKSHIGIKCEVVEWRKVSMNEPSRVGSKLHTYIFPNMNIPINKKSKS